MSLITIQLNGKEVQVPTGSTILEACQQHNVYVPTLCNHPRLPSTGGCRVCAIEVEGMRNLQTACTTIVSEGMVVKTKTDRVASAIQTNLSLLLARHPNTCMTCESNNRCEFQDLIYRYDVPDTFADFHSELSAMDESSPSLIRDLNKCILCSRCVRACSDIQGLNIYGIAHRGFDSLPLTAFDQPLANTNCINCGQCSAFCPTGAIIEKSAVHEVLNALEKKEKILIAQTAPSTRVAVGEEFGMDSGSVSTGKMVAALKQLGFDYVFDTDFSADLTIMEEGSEFLQRVEEGGPFPMFTSCCPGWVNFVEKYYPEYTENLSSAKSPQQMLGAVIKTYFAKKLNVDPSQIYSVSIMPCTAKKDEAERPQHSRDGMRDVDAVLTTRELGRLIRIKKIPYATLPDEAYDNPLGESTGAAVIFGVTGGVMEAALRTAYELKTGKPLPTLNFEPVRGLEGIKAASVDVNGIEIKVAVTHSMEKAQELVGQIHRGEVFYHFVEVMACQGGCIGGGGQPYSLDGKILQKRMASVYSIDERMTLRRSHENPSIQKIYEDFFDKPLSHLAHDLLHTHYTDRSQKVALEKAIHE